MPPRAHRVLLSKLGCLAARLNREIDKGSLVSIADAEKAIEQHRVAAFILERFTIDRRMGDIDCLCSEDDITISEYFERVSIQCTPSGFGVTRNGLAWFLALTIEMMAQEEWTSFDDR